MTVPSHNQALGYLGNARVALKLCILRCAIALRRRAPPPSLDLIMVERIGQPVLGVLVRISLTGR
jgi:hypothetical protein